MINEIVAQLKTGRVVNVVPYGMANLPSPPYIVVKPIRDPLGRGRMFEIYVHFSPGQVNDLEDYLFNDVSNLLDNFQSETRHGNTNKIYTEQEYQDIIISNDDKTISMMRPYLMPSKLF